MRFYLIRHGQTRWNEEGKIQGKTDIPLNETGLLQAECLADAMEHYPVTAIYCSVLERARQTAACVAERKQLAVRPMEQIREVDFGLWEGKTWKEIQETYPEDSVRWDRNPAQGTPTGGELRESCRQRVQQAVEQILAEAGGDVAVVAHGGILVYVIDYLLRNQPDRQKIIVQNASISVVEYDRSSAVGRLLILNDTSHLSDLSNNQINKH